MGVLRSQFRVPLREQKRKPNVRGLRVYIKLLLTFPLFICPSQPTNLYSNKQHNLSDLLKYHILTSIDNNYNNLNTTSYISEYKYQSPITDNTQIINVVHYHN